MTKEEIVDVLDNHSFKVYQHGDVVSKTDFNAIAKIISERLSEQKEKHDKEMEDIKQSFEKASYGCWDYIPQYKSWTNFDSGEKLTTTELLTKIKNR
jgi:methionine aminopeptidase